MKTNKRNPQSVLQRAVLSASIASILSLAANSALAGTIVGQISDNTGTTALAGAEVKIPELGRSAITASSGTFRFSDVDPGTYTIVVSYIGVDDVEYDVTVDDGIVRAEIGIGSSTDERIIVVGQRALMASSLSRQRASDTVDSVLTRDAIGQFPDQNVAEALRRAPGINVLNDQGEGRFVAVRGLNKDLNSVSINGARVPAPEADARFVALDVLPVELIESIEIKKSLTPDMDADTIGGAIEINTTSALDRREPYLGIALENSYNDLSGNSSPKTSIDFSRNFGDGVFGIAGGVSYYQREFSTDNIEAEDWDVTDAGIVFPEEVQYRDYDVERERLGMSLSFDFAPTDQILLFARMLHSEFDDQEFRGRVTFAFDEEPYAGTGDYARFSSDDGSITVERDIKDRFEAQEISSLVLGGEVYVDRWTFDLAASASASSEKESGSLDPTQFEREFEDPGEFDITIAHRRLNIPRFIVNSGADLFADPSEYELKDIERTTLSNAEDEEAAFEFNASREIALDSGSFEVSFGFKSRFRDKEYNKTVDFFELADDATIDYTLADVAGQLSYGLASLYPVPDPIAARDFFGSNFSQFERQINDSRLDSATDDFRVDEDIVAWYVSGRYENGSLRVVGGLRFEETENGMLGNIAEEIEEGSTYNDVLLTEDVVVINTQSFSRDYDDVYPSVNLRYELASDFILRAGYYESLVRPNINWLAPRFIVGEEDDEREGEFGNPFLQPYQASNFDFSAEWYFADNAVLSAGFFIKDVEDFIVVAEFEDVTFLGIQADEAEIPINGDEASIEGIEINYQHALTALRGPWEGLLFGVNYTRTETEGTVAGRVIPLPESSENVLNAMIGYEKNKWSLRLAATYRDEYLDELNFTGGADEDRYVKAHTQFDISAKYDVSDSLQVFLDLINLTDEPYVAFQNGPIRDRLLQYEEYSWTGKLGFRMNF